MEKSEYSPWNLFKESCDKYHNDVMIIYNEKEYTYGKVHETAIDFAQCIEKWDFKIGGVYLPNRVEFITCLLALNKQKKAFVSLSYQFKGDALIELINYTDIELLITDKKGYEAISNQLDKMNIRVVMILQESGSFEICEFLDKPKREIQGIDEDTFGICFTSGSTSMPKAIVLSNQAIVGNALSVAEHLGFTNKDRTIIPRSLAQASPISGDVLMAISRGGAIIILNNVFHPAIFLKAIEEHKATNFYIVRTMLLQVLEYPKLKEFDLSSIKRILIGGMINPLTIYQKTAERFPGVKIYNAYGTSEASARVTFGEHEDVTTLPCVIGKPMRGCSIKVYTEDGKEAGIGEIGEIYIGSDFMMKGYYKAEQLTKETLTSKGFRTRDIGYEDENGRFFVLSRNDDMIMQGGSRAYPIDIEEVLLRHEAVKECIVLGVEDDMLGQRIVALVCLKHSKAAKTKELFKWCMTELEDRKVPKEIYLIDSIPRNVIGKISKNDVKALYDSIISTKEA
ncbi:MAG: class I adenylate-forming enzyme family protein [Ruminiclostridium sp.]